MGDQDDIGSGADRGEDDVGVVAQAGVRVIPWTANDEATWARLMAIGVDGIITDDPAALIAYLRRDHQLMVVPKR